MLWNFSNYVSILLIKFGFIVPHSYSHRNTFRYRWFSSCKTIVSCLIISISSILIIRQEPHFEGSVRSPLTLSKMGLEDSQKLRTPLQGSKHFL
jgi:hypothetical protein